MVEKSCRHRISDHLLGQHRIGWNPSAGERRERTEIPQSKIAGDAQHGSLKIVRPAIDPGQKGGELELAQRNVEARALQPSLEHLLQRGFSASHRQKLETNSRAGWNRNRTPGGSTNRNIARSRRRNRTLCWCSESIDVAVHQLLTIDCRADRPAQA